MASKWFHLSSSLPWINSPGMESPQLSTLANITVQTSQTSQVSTNTTPGSSRLHMAVKDSAMSKLQDIKHKTYTVYRTIHGVLLQPVRCGQEAVGSSLCESQHQYWRPWLTRIQRDNSMLTFESSSVGGAAGIVEKLSVRHNIWKSHYY
jgi:hypothetical protein